MELMTLKMILQPIVENAIEHGMNGIDYKGLLQIRGSKEGDRVTLLIEDNGLGFDEVRLQSIRQVLTNISNGVKKDHKGSIGLINVHKRLHEHYGGESGVRIENDKGTCTRIVLTMMVIDSGLES